ncbi:MAG TPA: NAD(P)-binding domain-containing protein, partial [Candidatus Limnocylindrales bacterium]|nr:NAD(P)-binding domain-containing protein [Candidatus Limnocylindrales bacterium]
ALLLETCHRVEAYLTSADVAARLAAALPAGGRSLTGEDAVRHAMSVAVGRDSVVVGEDQVLHQLRASVDSARAAGTLDPAVERLFARALQAGRLARSWRQGPSHSLADVALASIEHQVGHVRDRDLLVVGAGSMGRLAARAAVSAGASVAVASRSADRAETLAASIGTRIEAFDPLARIGSFVGVIVALAGPWQIGAATIEALARGATVIVDLSVPAAVTAQVAEILGPRLITADALALGAAGPAAQDASAARLDALVERSTADFVAWLTRHDGRAAAEALVERADRVREAELAALWRRFPDLEPEARDAIEGMTRHLAGSLLREPLERLGRDADGGSERTIRDIFAL